MNNEQTVRDIYAAFGRGDVNAILSHVSDDVDWRNDGLASRECPWNGDFRGKANLPGFFKAVADTMNISVFAIKDVAASGSNVAVRLRIEATLHKNGLGWANDSVHFWTFTPEGKVASYRHFNDTAAELAAWRG